MSLNSYLQTAGGECNIDLTLLKKRLKGFPLFWKECAEDLYLYKSSSLRLQVSESKYAFVEFDLTADGIYVSNPEGQSVKVMTHWGDNEMAAAIRTVLE